MRCSKCGNKSAADTVFCTCCGNKVDNSSFNNNEKRAGLKPIRKKYLVLGLVMVLFIIYFFGLRCKAEVCLLPGSIGGDYCIAHTCRRDNCINKAAKGEKYCYTHMPTDTPSYYYTPESAEDVLKFSNVSITHNSSFTVCTGTITNNGRKTYTFVEIKGKFKDASGKVLDTDWTYATGSEGLAPGESTTFRISVKKNWDIKTCAIEILDYDRE